LVGETIQLNRRSRRVVGVLARDRFEELDNPSFAAYSPIRAAGILLDPPADGRFTPTLQFKAPTVEAVIALRDATIDWIASRYVRWDQRVRVRVGLEQLAEMEQAIFLAKLFHRIPGGHLASGRRDRDHERAARVGRGAHPGNRDP
jgi:hypothetical protein